MKKKYLIVGFGITLILAGCCTKVPPILEPQGASWDGNDRNSGFIGFYTNDSKSVFGVISTNALARYNGLIDIYRKKFIPPLYKDFGIINNQTNCYITLEGLQNFMIMNRWYKSEIKE